MARDLAGDIHQVLPGGYRNPESLPAGGVLVVGASATGAQLAAELAAAGRDVTIAVGNHTRMPRTYRGMDIYWWLDRIGVLDRTIDEMPDRALARRESSAQLVGSSDRRPLDLATLRADGVRLVGRATAVDGHRVRFAADLPATVAAAETRLRRLLARIDEHVDANGLHDEVLEPRLPRAVGPVQVVDHLDLRAAGIRTVVWATGHRRTYPWLRLPGVLDRHGEIRQHCGHTPIPGLYVLGQRFQHRRPGVERDRHGTVAGIVGRTRDGQALRARARIVVGADGIRSTIAESVGAPLDRLGTSVAAITYGYWTGLATDGYEWNFRPGAASGVIPTNGGQACVYASAPAGRVGRGGMGPLGRIVAESSADLAARLAAATPPPALRTFTGRRGHVRRSWGRGWALVGDAGYYKDPLTAHGLTDALRDAELLARGIAAVIRDGADERDALAGYQRTRDALSTALFDLTDVVAGHRWTDEEIPDLLRRVNAAMADEVETLAALPPLPPPPPSSSGEVPRQTEAGLAASLPPA